MLAKDRFRKQCILCTIGIVIVTVSTLFAVSWMELFEGLLAKEIELGPDSRSYAFWKYPPAPIYFDVYLFNWTNPSNFNGNEVFPKPILKEIGPYRFVEIKDKADIVWNDNRTVSFRRKSTYFFDAVNSNGKIDDMITTLDVVALTAGAKNLHTNYLEQKKVSLSFHLYDKHVYVTKSVKELLFDGYEDGLMDLARQLSTDDIPDKFGLFYKRNGTSHQLGHFNMHTGEGDISQIGQMKNWNFSPNTDYFPDRCGVVRGSAGEMYPPIKNKTKPISLFAADMCRSISLDFDEEATVLGITGNKYSGGRKAVDNGTIYSENKCFTHGDESVPSGVMNASECLYGSPAFVSFPHYYAADPYYLNQVEGLNPSRAKHEFYITLEPTTGIPLDVAIRFQMNMLIRPIPNIFLYQYAPHMLFPIAWYEQKLLLPSDFAAKIKIVAAIPLMGYVAAVIALLIGTILIFWWPAARMSKRKGKALVSKNGKCIREREDITSQTSFLSENERNLF